MSFFVSCVIKVGFQSVNKIRAGFKKLKTLSCGVIRAGVKRADKEYRNSFFDGCVRFLNVF